MDYGIILLAYGANYAFLKTPPQDSYHYERIMVHKLVGFLLIYYGISLITVKNNIN